MRSLLLACLLLHPFFSLNASLCHDRQADPSTYIYDCVNAINGSFVMTDQDLVVEGGERLEFLRNYVGGSSRTSFIGEGFSHNHRFFLSCIENDDKTKNMWMATHGGDSMRYICKPTPAHGGYWFFLQEDQIRRGLTNTAQGEISGRTNVKNNKIFATADNFAQGKKNKRPAYHCKAFLSDGTIRHYKVGGLLLQERRPNGNILKYTYDDKKSMKRVYATDPTESLLFGEFLFSSDKKWSEIVASNGKKITYHKDKKERVQRVEATGKSTQTYEYGKVTVREQKHTFLKRYYQEGFGGLQLEWNDKGRIKELSLLSNQKKGHKLFKIEYERRNRITKAKGYYSGDIYYHYDSHGRLTKKAFGGNSPYSVEYFFWGEKEKHPIGREVLGVEGNLITKGVGDGKGNIYTLTTYDYDNVGNLKRETIAGHLTGDMEQTPFVVKNNRPNLHGRETYSCTYTHSNNMYHLLLSKREDDGTEERYSYLPKGNKLEKQLSYANGTIIKRIFYRYNTYGMLVETICDNGSGETFDDLTDLTQRLITRVEPNTIPGTRAVGKPVTVTESYWDPETGIEQQLKRIAYTYGIYDLVTSIAHYDSHDAHMYTLEYTYDSHGNCIAETNAMGEVTLYTYDAYHRMIEKEPVGSGMRTLYTYDAFGNVISETEKHLSGETLTKTFLYDLFKRKVVTIQVL